MRATFNPFHFTPTNGPGEIRRRYADKVGFRLNDFLGVGFDLRPQRIQAAVDGSLLDWAKFFLPDHFKLPPSEMHTWLAGQLDAMRKMRNSKCKMRPEKDENQNAPFCNWHSAFCNVPAVPSKLNVIGPRGSAKSTIVTLAHVLREAVAGREKYIWIISDTREQAKLHLDNLRYELLHNERLYEAYPGAAGKKGPKWCDHSIVLPNGVRIDAIGTGQKVRGRKWRESRPTLIVCDDVQNDQHMVSPRQREKSKNWLQGLVMKAGAPDTHYIHLGTALHRECLAMELAKNPGWSSRTFQSIVQWPKRMELWSEWEKLYQANPSISPLPAGGEESGMRGRTTQDKPISTTAESPAGAFYQAHEAELHEASRVLWPARETLLDLMRLRAEGGPAAFDREKQSVPASPDMCEWPADYFAGDIWFDTWPENLKAKLIVLDPSKGTGSRQGDYSAFVMLGIDRDGVLYVEADLARRPTPQMVADGVELCRLHRPTLLGIEEQQCLDLLGHEFTRALNQAGLVSIVPFSISTQNVPKLLRIRRLGPHLAQKRFRFHAGSPGTRMLIEQLREFPNSSHDDGPDALEMSLRLAEGTLGMKL